MARRPSIFTRALAATVLIAAGAGAAPAPSAATEPKIGGPAITLGPIETVMGDGVEGLHYFPDGPVVVLGNSPLTRVLMVAADRTELLEGADFKSLKRITTVLGPGANEAFDNGYAGIYGAARLPVGGLLAFYHGEDHERMKPIPGGIPGFCCRIGIAVSPDDGKSFARLGPVIGGNVPKNPAGLPDQGDGEPCVITDPTHGWLYLYYTSHERAEGRGVDICLARAPLAHAREPVAWKKFRNGEFAEPGLGGRDTPVLTGGFAGTDAMMPYVVFVPALKQYLMTFCVNAWNQEGRKAGRSGIYIAWSTNSVNWPRASVRQIWQTPTVAIVGAPVAWHPMLLLDPAAGAGPVPGWMYFGYSPNWGSTPPQQPHFLVRRSIRIPVSLE